MTVYYHVTMVRVRKGICSRVQVLTGMPKKGMEDTVRDHQEALWDNGWVSVVLPLDDLAAGLLRAELDEFTFWMTEA